MIVRLGKILVVLLFAMSVVPVGAKTYSFPDKTTDTASMNALMEKVETGDITLEQALVTAFKSGISFSVIVEACNLRQIPLSNIITAATSIGISPEAILAWMDDAAVPKEQMVAAYTEATGQLDVGLGYTPPPQETTALTPVAPVTANPGGTIPNPSVSPSTL